MNKLKLISAVLVTSLVLIGNVSATEKDIEAKVQAETAIEETTIQSEEGKSGWQFEFTPYVWAAANNGSAGPFNENRDGDSDVDIDFQTLADHIEFGIMGNFSALNGDWLLYSEFTNLVAEDTQKVEGAEVDIEITGYIYDLGAGYRLIEKNNFELYGYAGVRFMEVQTDIGINDFDTDFGDDWIDPLVGLHAKYKINNTFSIQGRVEAGGFGVGSEESYMISTTVNHRLSKNWSLKYFYRYMKVDYQDNGFIYNMEVDGPGFGVSYKF